MAIPSVARTEAPHQETGSGRPSRKTEKRVTRTTLVPRSGVNTETSPVAMARKVQICPRKNRKPQTAGASSNRGEITPPGSSQSHWKENAMTALQITFTHEPEIPEERERLIAMAPQA